MSLRINTNIPALSAQRSIDKSTQEASKSYVRLASGQRISQAGDDAAGLSISQNLEAQVRGMRQAQRNANDGVSLVQTAEGGLNEVSNILIRLRELGVQAASDTIGDTERGFLDKEYQNLSQELERIAQSTNFNNIKLLSGDTGKDELHFQVGSRGGKENTIVFDVGRTDVRTSSLKIAGTNVLDRDDALDSLENVDKAINRVNEFRANLGALQSRLNSTSNSIGIAVENLTEAKSRIADTDVAVETSNLVKHTILQNAGIAVLAQANQFQNSALKLL